MSTNYQNKLNRTIYLSVGILLAIAVFSTFPTQRSHAGASDNASTVAPAFVDAGFNPVIGGSNGQVVDSFVQPDGKVLIAGAVAVVHGMDMEGIDSVRCDWTH